MSLIGKKVVCVGGNGFIGSYFASRLVQSKATVSILSRRGPKHNYPQNKQINWLIGDIFQPQKYLKDLNQADAIVHTVGTLIDTSITKSAKPGDKGTYQNMNRDSFKSLLSFLQSPKRIIYLSATGHPPFIHRYATTKKQAEDLLFNSIHQGYVFRPGFVYNWQKRWWSIPLKYDIQLWNKIFPCLKSMTFNGTFLQKFLNQFQQSEPTSLQKMGNALIQIIKQGNPQKILSNSQIQLLSSKFSKTSSQKSETKN